MTSRSIRCRRRRRASCGAGTSSAWVDRATEDRPQVAARTDGGRARVARRRRHTRRSSTRSQAGSIAAMVLPNANLELDLGLDSMERVEVLTLLERSAGRRVPAETRAQPSSRSGSSSTPSWPRRSRGRRTSRSRRRRRRGIACSPSRPTRRSWRTLAVRNGFARSFSTAASRVAGAIAARAVSVPCPGPRASARRRPVHHQPEPPDVHRRILPVAPRCPFARSERSFFVGAAEFFETPLMAWLARAVNIVPLDPDGSS